MPSTSRRPRAERHRDGLGSTEALDFYESIQEPTERFYGIDCAIRDPFGSHIRITQPAEGPIDIPEAAGETAST